MMLIAPGGNITQRWQGFADPAVLAQEIEKQLRRSWAK